MIGALRNLNGSRGLTTPLSGMICHRGLGLAAINLRTKFQISISAHYEDI